MAPTSGKNLGYVTLSSASNVTSANQHIILTITEQSISHYLLPLQTHQ